MPLLLASSVATFCCMMCCNEQHTFAGIVCTCQVSAHARVLSSEQRKGGSFCLSFCWGAYMLQAGISQPLRDAIV